MASQFSTSITRSDNLTSPVVLNRNGQLTTSIQSRSYPVQFPCRIVIDDLPPALEALPSDEFLDPISSFKVPKVRSTLFNPHRHREKTEELAQNHKQKIQERKGTSTSTKCDDTPVASWSCIQVLYWLKSIGLGMLHGNFVKHQVTGVDLLALDFEMLSKLDIKILAHRKLLLKRVRELTTQMNSMSKDGKVLTANMQHWSNIKPLKDNEVTRPEGGGFRNLADGSYNEQKERDSFQAAVLEWRGGLSKNQNPMWSNPSFN